jgi:hypothetical protein
MYPGWAGFIDPSTIVSRSSSRPSWDRDESGIVPAGAVDSAGNGDRPSAASSCPRS